MLRLTCVTTPLSPCGPRQLLSLFTQLGPLPYLWPAHRRLSLQRPSSKRLFLRPAFDRHSRAFSPEAYIKSDPMHVWSRWSTTLEHMSDLLDTTWANDSLRPAEAVAQAMAIDKTDELPTTALAAMRVTSGGQESDGTAGDAKQGQKRNRAVEEAVQERPARVFPLLCLRSGEVLMCDSQRQLRLRRKPQSWTSSPQPSALAPTRAETPSTLQTKPPLPLTQLPPSPSSPQRPPSLRLSTNLLNLSMHRLSQTRSSPPPLLHRLQRMRLRLALPRLQQCRRCALSRSRELRATSRISLSRRCTAVRSPGTKRLSPPCHSTRTRATSSRRC